MDSNNLSFIFGEDSIWDFYLHSEKIGSVRFDAPNNFITCTGDKLNITNINICHDYGILTFEKCIQNQKGNIKATLVFIKDKSILVGFEGDVPAKYIKTNKMTF